MTGDCVIFGGSKDEKGYGFKRRGGYLTRAHRWAYCDMVGIHPRDLGDKVVMHLCDNPSCVNPDHLKAGTVTENNRDRMRKGRSAVGEKNGKATITDDQVEIIRSRCKKWGDIKKLAEEFSVDRSTISDIVNYKRRFSL